MYAVPATGATKQHRSEAGGRPPIGCSQRKSERTGNTNFDLNRRASLRPYLERAGVRFPRATRQLLLRWDFTYDDLTKSYSGLLQSRTRYCNYLTRNSCSGW